MNVTTSRAVLDSKASWPNRSRCRRVIISHPQADSKIGGEASVSWIAPLAASEACLVPGFEGLSCKTSGLVSYRVLAQQLWQGSETHFYDAHMTA